MTERPTASEFMKWSPPLLNGDSPWSSRYAAEIRRIWYAHAAERPRSLQAHLGPSELGTACDRQVAGKLAGIPVTNHVVDPWPSIVGTALHKWAEDVFAFDNLVRDLARWITEQKVTPHPEHPGTADLYDALNFAVVDHKFLGESSMAKVRKGWPRTYRMQLLLYGLGYMLMGFKVRRVVLMAYPRAAASLDGIYARDLDFTDDDGNILPEVVEALAEVFTDTERRKQQAAQISEFKLRFIDVPHAPDSDDCYFCPFYRPQAAHDSGPGCPGPVSETPN